MKTTEELALEAKVSIRGHYDETGSTPHELETFRRLVIEDFVAGLEPVVWAFKDMTWTPIKAMGVDHNGIPLYSLEGVKK